MTLFAVRWFSQSRYLIHHDANNPRVGVVRNANPDIIRGVVYLVRKITNETLNLSSEILSRGYAHERFKRTSVTGPIGPNLGDPDEC